ncbi:hypothetical protein GCM10022414_26940 [Zhongshania borealis]|uniref:Uncharacterized protein n=2 Tax=Zhongshania borealis TaxID=889488 RepID=A0ABP7WZK3_9GAMM
MNFREIKKFAVIACATCVANVSLAIDLPIIGSLDLGGGSLGMPSAPLDGLPLLGDLSILGSLPVIDGRGLPVVGDLDGGLLIVNGLIPVVLSNPNLTGARPLDADLLLPVVDMLLNGGPSLDFVGLDLILP